MVQEGGFYRFDSLLQSRSFDTTLYTVLVFFC